MSDSTETAGMSLQDIYEVLVYTKEWHKEPIVSAIEKFKLHGIIVKMGAQVMSKSIITDILEEKISKYAVE